MTGHAPAAPASAGAGRSGRAGGGGQGPRRLGIISLLLAGGLLWWGGADEAAPATPRVRTRLPRPVGVFAMREPVDLELLAVDRQGQLVADLQVEVDGRTARTDREGAARFSLPAETRSVVPRVRAPWLLAEPARLELGGQRQVRAILVVAPSCPGPVRLRDEQGEPVAGALVWARLEGGEGDAGLTDDEGQVHLPGRPCGAVQVGYNSDAAGKESVAVAIQGGEPVRLQLRPLRRAELRLIGPDGGPGEAEVHASSRSEVVELAPGLYALDHRRPTMGLWVDAPGAGRQRLRVPLDGRVHEVHLSPARALRVELVGEPDGRAFTVSCGEAACAAAGPSDFECRCGASEAAWVRVRDDQAGAWTQAVPAEAVRVQVDVGPLARVRGRWTGALPCVVELSDWTRSLVRHACEADGGFEVEVPPGATTLSVRHGVEQQTQRALVLKGGERRDLGELGPSTVDLRLVVDSAMPLQTALLHASPGGRHTLSADLSVVLRGLPPPPGEVTVQLAHADWGAFRATLPYLVGQDELWWSVEPWQAQDAAPGWARDPEQVDGAWWGAGQAGSVGPGSGEDSGLEDSGLEDSGGVDSGGGDSDGEPGTTADTGV